MPWLLMPAVNGHSKYYHSFYYHSCLIVQDKDCHDCKDVAYSSVLVHFAGEALSSGHAWIIGAVNSAWRTVYEILCTEGMEDKKAKFIQTWNITDEVELGWYNWSPAGLPITAAP